MMSSTILLWIAFHVLILALLALDLGFHRNMHEIRLKEALWWSFFWILVALVFNAGVYFFEGSKPAVLFLTGYLIERALSMDNLFVFLLIFSYFRVPPKYQHKVLFWGIIGALFMRGFFIFTGVALIEKFKWTMYVFGIILIMSAAKMILKKDEEIQPEKNLVIKLFKRFFPVSSAYDEGRFLTKISGKTLATPLLVVLLVVETTDVIFAVDSIPAILAITLDRFIVYSSNVFAILGLRAMYFALSGIMGLFRFLNHGLALILGFVGAKMMLADYIHLSPGAALGIIAGILTLSILISIIFPKKSTGPAAA
jgi:tellurite resistance protein TerC